MKNAVKRGNLWKTRLFPDFGEKRGPQRGKRGRDFSVSLIMTYHSKHLLVYIISRYRYLLFKLDVCYN